MNVLVTGGAGFIGNHTVRYLIEKGYDVTVVDDLSRGNAGLLPLEAHFYPIDILTPQFQEFMAARHFDAVIHLAAQIEVASSERDPLRDASLNIGGTLAVLEGARSPMSAGSSLLLPQPFMVIRQKHSCRWRKKRLYVRCLLMD